MDEYLIEAISKFQRAYKPVDSVSEATHFFSTNEIYVALMELNPGCGLKIEQVFELLQSEGYSWLPDPEKMSFSFKWMVAKSM